MCLVYRHIQTPPPRLVLEEGGTSTFQAAIPGKLKSPHFKVPRRGDFRTSLGGSRWPDPAVLCVMYVYLDIGDVKNNISI